MAIERIIRAAVDRGASDVHIKAGDVVRARIDGRASTLADDLDEGDEVLVDGRPVEPGQVIVLRQVRERNETTGPKRRRA